MRQRGIGHQQHESVILAPLGPCPRIQAKPHREKGALVVLALVQVHREHRCERVDGELVGDLGHDRLACARPRRAPEPAIEIHDKFLNLPQVSGCPRSLIHEQLRIEIGHASKPRLDRVFAARSPRRRSLARGQRLLRMRLQGPFLLRLPPESGDIA